MEVEYQTPPRPKGKVIITMSEEEAVIYLRATQSSALYATQNLRKLMQDVIPGAR